MTGHRSVRCAPDGADRRAGPAGRLAAGAGQRELARDHLARAVQLLGATLPRSATARAELASLG